MWRGLNEENAHPSNCSRMRKTVIRMHDVRDDYLSSVGELVHLLDTELTELVELDLLWRVLRTSRAVLRTCRTGLFCLSRASGTVPILCRAGRTVHRTGWRIARTCRARAARPTAAILGARR